MSVELASAYVSIIPSMRGFSTKLAVAGEEAGALAGRRFSGAFATKVKAAGAATAVALTAVGVVAVKMAGDFQQNTNVLVTAAGESTKNLALIRKGILDIAVGTGTSWKALTDGIYGVEKAGFRGADALKILKAAAQGAREEGANLATVTAAMTSVMASYHLNASDSVKVMNEMKTAAGEAKTTMELFAGSLSTVLPLASANKISFADVAGTLASLTQHGTSADQAAQELAFTMRGLAAPNAVAVKEMAALGISSLDVALKLGDGPGGRGLAGTMNYLSQTVLRKMGPSGTLLLNTFNQTKLAAQGVTTMMAHLEPATQKLAKGFIDGSITAHEWRKAVNGMTPEQANLARQFATAENRARGFQTALKNGLSQNQTYSDAIKKMTGGANGLNTVLQSTGESMAGTNGRIKAIADSANGAGKDVSGWASTQKLFNVQMDQFKQAIDRAFITLGTRLIPVIQKVITFMGQHTTVVKILAAVIGGVLVAATVAWTVSLFTAGGALAFLISPVTLVVAAIAALAIGVKYAWDHFKTFRTVVLDVWHVIQVAAKLWWNELKFEFNLVMSALKAVAAVFTWLWRNIVAPVFNGIVGVIRGASGIISGIISGIGSVVRRIGGFFSEVYATVRSVVDQIVAVVKGIGGKIAAIARGIWSPLGAGLSAVVDTIRALVQPIIDAIQRVVNAAIAAKNFLTGGSGGNLTSPALAAAAAAARSAGSSSSAQGGTKAFAAGGPVAAGVPITVGERGRELFVPSTNGRIVPNNALGGSPTVYVQNPFTGEYLLARVADVANDGLDRLATSLTY